MLQTFGQWLNRKFNLVAEDPMDAVEVFCAAEHLPTEKSQIPIEEPALPLTLEEQKEVDIARIDLQISKINIDRLEHLEAADRLGLLIRNLLMERTKINSAWNQKIAEQSLLQYARLPGGIEADEKNSSVP
jgi:hypothetical protein